MQLYSKKSCASYKKKSKLKLKCGLIVMRMTSQCKKGSKMRLHLHCSDFDVKRDIFS